MRGVLVIRFEAPDAYDMPTLWEAVDEDDQHPQPILSKYDLRPEWREALWASIVKAVVTGE